MNTPSVDTASSTAIRGYKIFNSDWTCTSGNSNRVFKVGETYEYDSKLDNVFQVNNYNERGFVFCQRAINCVNNINTSGRDGGITFISSANTIDQNFHDLKFAEVEASDYKGKVLFVGEHCKLHENIEMQDYVHGKFTPRGNNYCVTKKLKIVREIPLDEFMVLCSDQQVGWYNSGQMKYKHLYKTNFGINNPSAVFHGKQEGWYENGKKKYEEFYKMGVHVGVQRGWYENGKKMYENAFGYHTDGLQRGWYENGQQKYEQTSNGGRFADCTQERWYRNGIKTHVLNYKNGKRCGLQEEWDEDGNKILEIIYRDGVVIERII